MWLVYALLASLVWGLDYTLAERVLHRKVSPSMLIGLQMCGGSILFIISVFIRGTWGEFYNLMQDKRLLRLTTLTVLGFVFGNLLIASSIRAKNATASSLVEVSYPLAIVLFTWLLFHEAHLTAGTVIGGGFILVGIILMYCLG